MQHTVRAALSALSMLGLLLGGCAGTWEQRTRDDLDVAARRMDEVGTPETATPAAAAAEGHAGRAGGTHFDGTLAAYVAYAMRHSPSLRASFDRWRAAVLHISRARRLPEPTLSFGYFLQSVETRVGPQQFRLSLSQAFPWPTKLSAGADASSAMARAAERRFDAESLALRRQVATAYYALWRVRRTRALLGEQREVLRGLSDSARGRVETGGASLADMAQAELGLARLEDRIDGLSEDARAAAARLLAVVGAPTGTAAPTGDAAPPSGLPAQDEATLLRVAYDNPRIVAFDRVADASDAAARREAADRWPSFMLGVDWIETGPAAMPNVPDSGKDALIAMASVRLPLWWGSYTDAVGAAHAEGAAARADGAASRFAARQELEDALSAVRDAERRIRLYEGTLLPQAQTVYGSVLGGYQAGRSTIAATLLAERDVLELDVSLAKARADHATAWARLEQVVGREVARAARPSDPGRSAPARPLGGSDGSPGASAGAHTGVGAEVSR